LGEFSGSTLNCEGNLFGGIKIWAFLGFCSVVHVGLLRRGGPMLRIWGNLSVFGGVFPCNVCMGGPKDNVGVGVC
jgi:hypothetical protein